MRQARLPRRSDVETMPAAASTAPGCAAAGRLAAELAVAEDRLDQVTNRLEGVERRAAPAVATYEAACAGVRQATDAVHDHDLIGQLDRPHITR